MCDCGIYENGRSVKIFSEGQYPYTAGDYLKIERDGTTINYYLVKVGDALLKNCTNHLLKIYFIEVKHILFTASKK
jgi:hypothetical protein